MMFKAIQYLEQMDFEKILENQNLYFQYYNNQHSSVVLHQQLQKLQEAEKQIKDIFRKFEFDISQEQASEKCKIGDFEIIFNNQEFQLIKKLQDNSSIKLSNNEIYYGDLDAQNKKNGYGELIKKKNQNEWEHIEGQFSDDEIQNSFISFEGLTYSIKGIKENGVDINYSKIPMQNNAKMNIQNKTSKIQVVINHIIQNYEEQFWAFRNFKDIINHKRMFIFPILDEKQEFDNVNSYYQIFDARFKKNILSVTDIYQRLFFIFQNSTQNNKDFILFDVVLEDKKIIKLYDPFYYQKKSKTIFYSQCFENIKKIINLDGQIFVPNEGLYATKEGDSEIFIYNYLKSILNNQPSNIPFNVSELRTDIDDLYQTIQNQIQG